MDEFSKEEMAQLLGMFRHQSLEILDEMYQDLLALESAGLDDELIRRIRRSAHTIKGDAACVDLVGVTETAHRVEDLIDRIVGGEQTFRTEVVDAILESLDAMRAAIGSDEVRDISAAEVEQLSRTLARSEVAQSDEDLPLVARSPQPVTGADKSADGGADADASLQGNGDSPAHSQVNGQVNGHAHSHANGHPGNHEDAAHKDTTGKRKQDFVRVEAATIDTLLNLAGEMVVARSVMNQVGNELEETLAKSEVAFRFNGANAQIGKLIAELQKSVLKMRMVSISQVFKRFTRPMRELASEYGKQLDLVTSGEDTELDRTLVDMMYEPLLHLLRNAVDHGLEMPEERLAAGKSATGTIKLSAYHEGNQIIVEVSDDGRGIDVESLKAKAVATGAISESEALGMANDDALNLIFHSGLSTAKEITWVSGRGVGAGAVKAAVEQLRGNLSVRSTPGSGTTFTLRMPLTLAIIKALLFRASGRLYALPLLAISEITLARPEQVLYIDGLESFRLRDRYLSLVRPGVVLGYERRKGGIGSAMRGGGVRVANNEVFIIVVQVGGKRFGVVAETLLGEQELVIKPLDSDWLQSEALAGASVLGDGNVALILDAGVLVRKAVKYERARGAGIGVYVQ